MSMYVHRPTKPVLGAKVVTSHVTKEFVPLQSLVLEEPLIASLATVLAKFAGRSDFSAG